MNDFRVSRDNFLLLSILFFVENLTVLSVFVKEGERKPNLKIILFTVKLK